MSYSRNSKKNITGKGRRTYKTRTTPGRNGPFHYKQKILIRYDSRKNASKGIENLNIIDDLVNKTIDSITEVMKGEQEVANKAKAYWLRTIKKLTPVDTGMLRDKWRCHIVWSEDRSGWWLEWENTAKNNYGFEYVESQNYGWWMNVTDKKGNTVPKYIPGYHFLEKADFMTSLYILKLKVAQKNKVMSKARSLGGS